MGEPGRRVIVEGAIVDADGARPGYVRFRGDAVAEVGKVGTDSTRGRVRRVRGIVVPAPINGHTHLGDFVSTREPPHQPIEELVRPPDGFKFRLLASASTADKARALKRAVGFMVHQGTAGTIDFREEGVDGVRRLRSAAHGSPFRAIILGRPLRRPIEPNELDALLTIADGVGVSSAREESLATRRAIARACRARRRKYALHASETVRESPDNYLDPCPDLLIHLTHATSSDLERVADARTTVAVCPRSNALFRRRPPLAELRRRGIRWLVGTDNGMFNAPSIFRELEFAYLSARSAGQPIPPTDLARAAFVSPWEWLGEPERARVEPDGAVRPLALRLPPDDPEYQLVARAGAQLIVRPERRSGGRGAA